MHTFTYTCLCTCIYIYIWYGPPPKPTLCCQVRATSTTSSEHGCKCSNFQGLSGLIKFRDSRRDV